MIVVIKLKTRYSSTIIQTSYYYYYYHTVPKIKMDMVQLFFFFSIYLLEF